MGGIDEAALDRLSLVTEMTKHIRVKAGDSAGELAGNQDQLQCLMPRQKASIMIYILCSAGAEQLAEFTPSFLWLLRDFYLSLEEDGHKVRVCTVVWLPCWHAI